jgi:ATP-dependent DNA helicase PIF1
MSSITQWVNRLNDTEEKKNDKKPLVYPEGIGTILDDIFKHKRHVFFHGFAGTGKSTRIKFLHELAERKGVEIALTSTTGVSAINVGGVTIHSWSGLGYGENSAQDIVRRMGKPYKYALIERLRTHPIVVIDEVSMLHGALLDKIDLIFRYLLKVNKPFGGKQMIFSGDVLQLPPVEPDKEIDDPTDYFFKANVWKEITPVMRFVELTKAFRHPDKAWHQMLMRIRYAVTHQDDHKVLIERISSEEQIKKENPLVLPPRLFPLRWQVAKFNDRELQRLDAEEKVYISKDTAFSKTPGVSITRYYNPSAYFLKVNSIDLQFDTQKQISVRKALDSYASRKLRFKVGANVMLTQNMLDDGLANGSQGIIRDMGEDHIVVEFRSQPERLMKICLAPHYILAGKKFYCRFQIPLMLSWATTIHKTQGATLECAVMDLGPKVFAPSQAYVALSRVKTLKGIYLLRYDPKSIRADKEALNYAMEAVQLARRKL